MQFLCKNDNNNTKRGEFCQNLYKNFAQKGHTGPTLDFQLSGVLGDPCPRDITRIFRGSPT